ncbi:pyrimidine reductase family protein [Arthrobacter sp. AZCC_0090]|uniref:pyrimidine reductase family protein n=1 Tax=Arthrobacter sp. AZCC_0090 TaxID=2735881 RepID=UPI00178FD3CD|nr:pyrimidine reductase family protein [Arthrobacter sp. AZCC_0090]MBB6406270.1 riboflavin biosynthesis pyrimidine reductase [Arthrobacter sp. AZCC_0090]
MFDRSELIRRYSVNERETPHLRANFIASVDGAASFAGLSGPLNNAADKQVFDTLRMLSDVVLVGAGTLRTEDYGPLILDDDAVAWRVEQGLAPQPVLAIVSARLELDHSSEVFSRAPVRPLVFTHGRFHQGAPAELAAVADVEICGEHSLDVAGMWTVLNRRGLTQVLTEGGPRLFGSLAAADAVDELCLTLSPVLAGGGAGRITAGSEHGLHAMRLAHVLTAGDMLMLRYMRSR